MQQRSSIVAELGWLGLFLGIFAVLAYCSLRFLVPHHFNDRIAILLSAIVAGLIWTALRARAMRRGGRN
ncbi:MAG: hypothetical protein ACYDA5_03205 [Vulcanimicrobiaceae bacterium]